MVLKSVVGKVQAAAKPKTQVAARTKRTGVKAGSEGRVKTESSEQVLFVARVRHFHPDLVLMSIPNGGKRDARTATMMKKEGVLPGAPDLFLAEPRQGWHGLFIEMKRSVGGKTSSEQESVLAKLKERGYACVVAHGEKEAYGAFLRYVYGDSPPAWCMRYLAIPGRS